MSVQESFDASKGMAVYQDTANSILLKRLELMETLSRSSLLEQRRAKHVAKETLQRYTTLASDLGLKQIKDRLEDLSFQILHPEDREQIIDKVTCLFHLSGQDSLRLILENLKKTLLANGLTDFKILGREKTPFSIWQKLKRKALEVEQIRDILGFRVIVSTIEECYLTINILHDIFPLELTGFKDYILFPKDKMYQSLHTTLIGPYQKRIEVQVRTAEMDSFIINSMYKEYWQQKTCFL